jgi:hypothetical protein
MTRHFYHAFKSRKLVLKLKRIWTVMLCANLLSEKKNLVYLATAPSLDVFAD